MLSLGDRTAQLVHEIHCATGGGCIDVNILLCNDFNHPGAQSFPDDEDVPSRRLQQLSAFDPGVVRFLDRVPTQLRNETAVVTLRSNIAR